MNDRRPRVSPKRPGAEYSCRGRGLREPDLPILAGLQPRTRFHISRNTADFPEFNNALENVAGAQPFLRKPPPSTLSKVRTGGTIARYDPVSDVYGVMTSGGAPRTLFRPDPANHGFPSNLDYFNAQ